MPLAARDLALAEKKKLDLVTICSGCYLTFSRANEELAANSVLKNKMNQALTLMNLEYKGKVKIRHMLDVVVNDLGIRALVTKMKMPLRGLRVAPFYGCQLLRPPEMSMFDEPESPHLLEDLVCALGAEAVDYRERVKCCGGPLYMADEKVALALARECLAGAKSAGANCITTACPLCHFMLDAQQSRVESLYSAKVGLPVLHFTQLIGMALGISPKRLKMSQNMVSTKNMANVFSHIGVYYSH